jgi:polysaccharide deacetylase family protein (PEP-CTERM system associated)
MPYGFLSDMTVGGLQFETLQSPDRLLHAISVDVEDWFQSTIDADAPLSERFERSTDRVLEAFAAHGVRGTFFVLGLAAEKAPHVVRRIADAGHEIQSHGHGHRSNFELTPVQFRQDVLCAKRLIEDLCGREVYGYRAPSFSIDERNLWVLDVLAETGHRYDSSIFPLKTARYGIAGYPPEPRIVTTPRGHRLVESPVACFDWLGKRRAVGGGGYFRLWPYPVIRKAWRQLEARGRPGIVYFHPYEYDPAEMDSFKSQISLRQRIHQGLGRKGFPRKIDRLLSEFRFGTMAEVLSGLLAPPQ